ncbi:hypothetical protein LCGC14_3037770 [marine sediment metagenome]|uniref:Uncharacterized protein n=1 Tax=marine sediment metagenome TaxID=412755 RepID=A0A0F8XDR2_9ZZZZ
MWLTIKRLLRAFWNGFKERWAEWVEVVEWYRDGDRARAARRDNAQPGESCLVDETLRGDKGQ